MYFYLPFNIDGICALADSDEVKWYFDYVIFALNTGGPEQNCRPRPSCCIRFSMFSIPSAL